LERPWGWLKEALRLGRETGKTGGWEGFKKILSELELGWGLGLERGPNSKLLSGNKGSCVFLLPRKIFIFRGI